MSSHWCPTELRYLQMTYLMLLADIQTILNNIPLSVPATTFFQSSCPQSHVGIKNCDKGARNSYIGLHWAFWGIILQGIFVRLATVYIHAKCGQSTQTDCKY